MYEQTKALKEGKSVDKPIYNHVTGLLDPAEKIESPKILVRSRLAAFPSACAVAARATARRSARTRVAAASPRRLASLRRFTLLALTRPRPTDPGGPAPLLRRAHARPVRLQDLLGH